MHFYPFKKTRYFFRRSYSDQSSLKLIIILSLLVGSLVFGNLFLIDNDCESVSPRLFVSKPQLIPINYVKSFLGITVPITIDIKQSEYKKLVVNSTKKDIQRNGKRSLIIGEISYLSKKIPAVFYRIGRVQKEKESDILIGVQLDKENTMFGIKKFKLIPCKPALHFTSWLFHKFEKYEKLISPEIRFVYLIINGKNLGLYTFFEEYDTRIINGKIQLPNYQLFDGTLFSFSNRLVSPIGQQSQIFQLLLKLYSQNDYFNEIGTVITIPEMARSFALKYFLTGIYNKSFNGIQLFKNNENGLIIPVGINWSKILKYDQNDEIRKKRECDSPKFLNSLLADDVFLSYFQSYSKRMADHKYIDTFLEIHRSEIDKNLRMLHRWYPSLSFNTTLFYLRDKAIYADLSSSARN